MRKPPTNHIRDLWNSGTGLFVGEEGAPNAYVTVETGWELTPSSASTVDGVAGPLRWFQRADNSQVETEIPNIKSITVDRSIDTDAATCRIELYNFREVSALDVGTRGETINQPGYFTFNRGETPDSNTFWGWNTNEWQNVLTPNALIRTYQGYGGRNKDLDNAIDDGNVVQTGLWLVDDISITARGNLQLSCRDMMKLVIDQEIYPPLVPARRYPLYYYRWKNTLKEAIPYGTTVYQQGWTPLHEVLTGVVSTSTLEGATIAGHTKADAIDGEDSETYWLSGGHVTGTTTKDLEWIQWNTANVTFNGFAINPFAGNYLIYVSVMIGGVWQGTSTIPYTGTQFTGTYEPKIKYVQTIRIGWEYPAIKYLAETYENVQKIRLTFTNLAKTSVGPKYYRCGIRQIYIGNSNREVTGNPKKIYSIIAASDTEDKGYWLVGNDGGVFTYGPNLRFWGSEGSTRLNEGVRGAFSSGNGGGYLLAAEDGGAFAFGNVPFQGSLPGRGIDPPSIIIDVAEGDGTPGHKGYWMVNLAGEVYTFGNASYHGNAPVSTFATAIAKCETGGYWIVDIDGNVFALGGAPYLGNASSSNVIVDIEGTSTGNGYWIVSETGEIYAFGDAGYFGGANTLGPLNDPISSMARNFDDNGYWLVGEDGGVFAYGSAHFWGSLPEQQDFSTTGNYQDYTDIVRELLLWSGFWRYIPAQGNNSPADVFGNLEDTGIYAPANLTEAFFDKKPVIDIINQFKEIVGYIAWVDEIGGFHFETPNIWSIGNFLEDGTPTAVIPVVDEEKQILDYNVGVDWSTARSTITISSADPLAKFPDTVSTTITSQWGGDALRGLVKPALWVNGSFVDKTVQRNMAELIDLHLFMASRQGQLRMPANPILQINDQIRIYERTTSDTYIHYLRGYTSTMDLESGSYTMDIQTHWMGDGDAWFLDYV